MMLETDRLSLLPFTLEDEAEAFRLFTDPDFMVDAIETVLTRETAMKRLEGYLRVHHEHGFSKLAVRWKGASEIIGYCGFGMTPLDGIETPELGYRLDPAVRGQGVATEAARAVVDWGFGELGMTRINAIVLHDNVASIKVLEKLGFDYVRDTDVEGRPWMFYRLERSCANRK